jgi:hypothetical protein
LALFGHGAMSDLSPFSGVKPTWAGRRGMSACDPTRKSADAALALQHRALSATIIETCYSPQVVLNP